MPAAIATSFLADLGNAIRKIRIDLGIPIEFPKFSNFRKYDEGGQTFYCSVGQIRYGVEDKGKADGLILYLKPTIRGDETADVLNYERQHRDFPHESTADQWFTESQFESYRALGEQEMTKILKEPATCGNPYAAAKRSCKSYEGSHLKPQQRDYFLAELL